MDFFNECIVLSINSMFSCVGDTEIHKNKFFKLSLRNLICLANYIFNCDLDYNKCQYVSQTKKFLKERSFVSQNINI